MTAAVRLIGGTNLGHLSAPMVVAFRQAAGDIVLQHGEDVASLEQAAAHEAGHVLLAWTLECKVKSAQLKSFAHRGRLVWLGESRWSLPIGDAPFTLRERPDMAVVKAAVVLAGLMGEEAVGIRHPSSSIDERMIVTAICDEVDESFGLRRDHTAGFLTGHVQATISKHRAAFDALRTGLERFHRLSPSEIRRALADVETTYRGAQ